MNTKIDRLNPDCKSPSARRARLEVRSLVAGAADEVAAHMRGRSSGSSSSACASLLGLSRHSSDGAPRAEDAPGAGDSERKETHPRLGSARYVRDSDQPATSATRISPDPARIKRNGPTNAKVGRVLQEERSACACFLA